MNEFPENEFDEDKKAFCTKTCDYCAALWGWKKHKEMVIALIDKILAKADVQDFMGV